MNTPRFEVYPRTRLAVLDDASRQKEPTGDFGWRFRAANGKINAVGGEGFTRREDARRALTVVAATIVSVATQGIVEAADIPIIDVEAETPSRLLQEGEG